MALAGKEHRFARSILLPSRDALQFVAAFELREDEGQSFRSLVAPMCLAQSLVVALGHRLATAPRKGNGR